MLIRMAKIHRCHQVLVTLWSNWNSHSLLKECKMMRPLLKTVWRFLAKLPIVLPHHPATALLAIHPNELKTYISTKTCTAVFITALLIIAETQKKARCHSGGAWINKLWYIHPTGCCLARQRDELLTHEKIWRKLQCILPSLHAV